MPGLKEVAQKAGVSVATASRALHNDGRITDATKDKVNKAAEELGYIKHKQKGSPATNWWSSVGLIVPEVMSGYYAQLVHLACDYFARNHYAVNVRLTGFDRDAMVRHIYGLAKLDVKCMLLLADDSEEISPELLHAVNDIKRPAMLITSRYFSNLDFDSLYIDERRGITMGLEHLFQRGYRRIGFIGEKQTLGRCHVYEKAMQKLGLPINPAHVILGETRAEAGGYEYMKAMLQQPDLPDAVFASYDQMAIGAIHAIHQAGLRIPEDIAVIGFDDMIVSQYIDKGLTTIQNPYEDAIAIAVRVLMNRLADGFAAPQQIALRPTLVHRGTT